MGGEATTLPENPILYGETQRLSRVAVLAVHRPNSPEANTPHKARVVCHSLITASIAAFQMSAQRGRAAQADIAQHLPLLV